MTVSFLPNVVRCETCDQGVACAQADGVWLCESCFAVLVPTPAPLPTMAQRTEREECFAPSLFETLETLLRSSTP